MSNFLRKNTKLKKSLESALKTHEQLLDIILFGSAVRGKEEPRDLDILLVFKDKVDREIVYDLRKEFERRMALEKTQPKVGVDVDAKSYHEIFESRYLPRERILAEGYSIKNGDFIHSLYGYIAFSMFRYSLKGKKASERVRFYYALLGRGKKEKGIIDSVNGIKFSNSVVLVPVDNEEKFSDFLKNWRIEYKLTLMMIPARTLTYREFQE